MKIKRVKEKTRYDFVDARCLGRKCFAPGMYQHRSPMSCGGSRNTGSPDSPCCLNRAYRGCPDGPEGRKSEICSVCNENRIETTASAGAGHSDDLAVCAPCSGCGGHGEIIVVGLPLYDKELAKQRKAEGWKVA